MDRKCLTAFEDVTVNSVEALMDAVVHLRVSGAIEADSLFVMLYAGNVMHLWRVRNLDYGVLAVSCVFGSKTNCWSRLT